MAKVGFWLRGSRGKLAGASMGKGLNGQTIIREIVTPRNPNTISQISQRMKISPAHRFFNAFSNMLNNAFEGVNYGADSRRHFMMLAMKMTGPFVQRGVTRFVPAIYPFSRGSLNTVSIQPFNGGATVITLSAATSETTVTPAVLAETLGVRTDYQISVAVVNNKLGIFEPSYISFEDRLTIADLPQAALAKDAENHITIDIAGIGLDASTVVAMAVVLSTQDSTGKWLRSSQDMVISNELYNSLYSTEAYDAAVESYQTESPNAINSIWYYNLGINQPFNGRLQLMTVSGTIPSETPGAPADSFRIRQCVVGVQEENGRIVYSVFVDNVAHPSGIYEMSNGVHLVPSSLINDMIASLTSQGYMINLWDNSYAYQLSGASGTMNRSAARPNTFAYPDAEHVHFYLAGLRKIQGKVTNEGVVSDTPLIVAYDTEGNEHLIKCTDMESRAYEMFLKQANGFMTEAWIAHVTTPDPEAEDAFIQVSLSDGDIALYNWLVSQGMDPSVFIYVPA